MLRRPLEFTQYTAIDDATRIRALQIYEKHTQANAIAFVDHVIGRFPFRIHTIRTDIQSESDVTPSSVGRSRKVLTSPASVRRTGNPIGATRRLLAC